VQPFNTIPDCDGQMDGQTGRISVLVSHVSVLMCDKNEQGSDIYTASQ